MDTFRHPLNNPSTESLMRGDGEHVQFAPDENDFAKVTAITAVTGGQLIQYIEQTCTGPTNATPVDASNPGTGEALVPTSFGTVSVGDFVIIHRIPEIDQVLAEPVASSGRKLFVARVTDATVPDSWRSQTLSGGVWADDAANGTDNAYPVQLGGADFTPSAGSQSIMWEEPPGSGIYAFMPIQFANATAPGFVSTGLQTFGGVKRFSSIWFSEGPGLVQAAISNYDGYLMVYGDPSGSPFGGRHGGFSVQGPDGTFRGIDAVVFVDGVTMTFKGGILVGVLS